MQKFIGTQDYLRHKQDRFRKGDEQDLQINEAFLLNDPKIFNLYQKQYDEKSALYYGAAPSFKKIMEKIRMALIDL